MVIISIVIIFFALIWIYALCKTTFYFDEPNHVDEEAWVKEYLMDLDRRRRQKGE